MTREETLEDLFAKYGKVRYAACGSSVSVILHPLVHHRAFSYTIVHCSHPIESYRTTHIYTRTHIHTLQIAKLQIVLDPHTRESRQFAFVTMADKEGATAAIEALNGLDLDGRTISVELVSENGRVGPAYMYSLALSLSLSLCSVQSISISHPPAHPPTHPLARKHRRSAAVHARPLPVATTGPSVRRAVAVTVMVVVAHATTIVRVTRTMSDRATMIEIAIIVRATMTAATTETVPSTVVGIAPSMEVGIAVDTIVVATVVHHHQEPPTHTVTRRHAVNVPAPPTTREVSRPLAAATATTTTVAVTAC